VLKECLAFGAEREVNAKAFEEVEDFKVVVFKVVGSEAGGDKVVGCEIVERVKVDVDVAVLDERSAFVERFEVEGSDKAVRTDVPPGFQTSHWLISLCFSSCFFTSFVCGENSQRSTPSDTRLELAHLTFPLLKASSEILVPGLSLKMIGSQRDPLAIGVWMRFAL
jgi:hypothetical protein